MMTAELALKDDGEIYGIIKNISTQFLVVSKIDLPTGPPSSGVYYNVKAPDGNDIPYQGMLVSFEGVDGSLKVMRPGGRFEFTIDSNDYGVYPGCKIRVDTRVSFKVFHTEKRAQSFAQSAKHWHQLASSQLVTSNYVVIR